MAEATKKKTTPKAPQDRKPKAVKEDITLTPGWNLLKDMSDIPVWDQTPLISLLQDALDTGEEDDEDNTKRSVDVGVVGTIAKALIPFAIDEAEYLKFCSGPGALERTMNLAMAWVGQMGEFMGSGN